MYDEIILRWKKANPMTCSYLGFHEYDGILADYNPDKIQNRIEEIMDDIEKLKGMGEVESKRSLFEHNLILARLNVELYFIGTQREFLVSPLPYIGPLGVIEGLYSVRSFASIDDRIKSIIKIQSQIPELIEQAKNNLTESLARPKIKMSVSFLTGIINFYRDKLIDFVSQTSDDQLMEDWSDANAQAVLVMEQFLNELKTKYMEKSHDDFALGKEKFLEMLERTEGVRIDVDKLLEIGETDLKNNYEAIMEIGNKLGLDIKTFIENMRAEIPHPSQLVEKVVGALDRTRDFLIEKDIVTLPSTEQCQVKDMPEAVKKFAFAAMNTPGPFETPEASEAYYYINIPPANLTEEQMKQRMGFFNNAQLELVTIHEAWPGHYLQLLVNNKSDSDIAKMFARSTTMIEGWGLYTEQMVIDEGYDKMDRDKLRIAQLIAAVVRSCRFVSAVRMHCKRMTVDESKQLFMEKGFLPEAMASIEANRGTVNPMYLNYTLGKLMIMKLREDYKRELGDEYTIKKFHNKILSFASPPITVLRKMILENPGGMEAVI